MVVFSSEGARNGDRRMAATVGEISLVSSSIYECLTYPLELRHQKSKVPDFESVDASLLMKRLQDVIGPVDPEMGFVPAGGRSLVEKVSFVASRLEIAAMRSAIETALAWEADDFRIYTGFAPLDAQHLIDELTMAMESF